MHQGMDYLSVRTAWLLAGLTASLLAEPAPAEDGANPVLTRLFWQDRSDATLKWADVGIGPALSKPTPVAGFPKLDPESQDLVQMEAAAGVLLVGVRDRDKSAKASGYVAVRSGVEQEEHGDHSHWEYPKPPATIQARIDAHQGNPAHLYKYGPAFYVANDANSGCTRVDPIALLAGKPAARFLPGGGNHITMAAFDGEVMYAGWVDGGGPNKGRVDVTPLAGKPGSEPAIAYRLTLPTGGLHGMTAAAGRVFFAPSDGICWCAADRDGKAGAQGTAIKHLSLGKDSAGKPLRCGAFETLGDQVLFAYGKGPEAALGIVDAAAKEPAVVRLEIPMAAGSAPTPPVAARVGRKGKPMAFLFHDHARDADLPDLLTVVDLDPDGDGGYADAKVAATLPVGKAAVDGHFGHHAVALDAGGRNAYVANPGDGTITPINLSSMTALAPVKVGGQPGAILAVGGRSGH